MGKNDKAWHNASCTPEIVQQSSCFTLLRAAALCTSIPINQILFVIANHLSCHVLPHVRKLMQIRQRWSQTSDLGSPHVFVTNSSWFKLVWLVHQCTSWIIAWYGQSGQAVSSASQMQPVVVAQLVFPEWCQPGREYCMKASKETRNILMYSNSSRSGARDWKKSTKIQTQRLKEEP